MTTIATSRHSIACDLQFTYGTNLKFKGKTKIVLFDAPLCKELFGVKSAYIGMAGNVDRWGEVISWLVDPTTPMPRTKSVEYLMLTCEGGIYHGSSLSSWMKIEEPHFAIGSGMQYALGAMEVGKAPIEAVKIASKHDPMTGMGFLEYKFK